jgi:hypothetical protein
LATKTTGEKKSAKKSEKKTTGSTSNGRKHTVVGSLANLELVKAKSALRLEIFSEATKLGELEIGRGSLYWWGHGRTKSARIDWTRFAAMMDEIAYEKRR